MGSLDRPRNDLTITPEIFELSSQRFAEVLICFLRFPPPPKGEAGIYDGVCAQNEEPSRR